MLPTQLWQVIWGFIWNTHWRKAKKCEYVFSRAGNLRRPLKLHNELHWRKMQPMQIWKIEQMQLAWICILPVMPFEDTFVKHTGEKPNKCNECDVPSCQAKNLTRHLNRHSGKKPKIQPMRIWKIEQMQLVWLRILPLMFFLNNMHFKPNVLMQLLSWLSGKKHTGEKSYKSIECDLASFQTNNLTFDRHLNKGSLARPKVQFFWTLV